MHGNLWIIFVILKIFTGSLWAACCKILGVKIWPEEWRPKVSIIYVLPFLALLIITIFTPIVVGTLFYVGSIIQIISGVIYVLAIVGFIKSKKGVNTIGIYRFSRNPMHVAVFLFFIGFIFMTWQADPIKGILSMIATLLSAFAHHWVVLKEERFLIEKYGDSYREYMDKTSRYWGCRGN